MNSYTQNRSENRGDERPMHSQINKNFYAVHEDTKDRPQKDVDAFLAEHEIRCDGKNVPRPIQTFKESSLPKYLLD